MDQETKQKILEELGGIPEEVYDDLLKEFVTQTNENLAKTQSCLESDNFEELAKIAHALKGASGNLRVNTIYALAKDVEMEAKGEKNKETIQGKLKTIQDELGAL